VFKSGDKVVIVDYNIFSFDDYLKLLKNNKLFEKDNINIKKYDILTVRRVWYSSDNDYFTTDYYKTFGNLDYIYINLSFEEFGNSSFSLDVKRFISLKEYRKLKLKKINNSKKKLK